MNFWINWRLLPQCGIVSIGCYIHDSVVRNTVAKIHCFESTQFEFEALKMKTLLFYLYLIAYSSCSVQKTFDKKYVTTESIKLAKVKTLHTSSNQMNKITCSSLCLRDSRENCNAFRVNSKNECELIENPEQLQEQNPSCLDGTLGQKSSISQNSQFQNIIFHKIHNFKVSFFTKFTILISQFS